MKSINWMSIIYGLAAYLIAWVLWNLASPPPTPEVNLAIQSGWGAGVFNILSAMIPGYVAAITAKRHVIVHGVIAGISLVFGMVVLWVLEGVIDSATPSSLAHTFIHFVALSSFGALLARWQL